MKGSSRKNSQLTKKQLETLMDKVQGERERITNKLNLEGPATKNIEMNSGKDLSLIHI